MFDGEWIYKTFNLQVAHGQAPTPTSTKQLIFCPTFRTRKKVKKDEENDEDEPMKSETKDEDASDDDDTDANQQPGGEDADVRDVIYKLELLAWEDWPGY